MSIEHLSLAELRVTNERLQASLDKCHDLVAEYRSKLAANSNGSDPKAILDSNDNARRPRRSNAAKQ